MIYKFPAALRNAIGQLIADAMDAGSGPGKIKFHTRSLGTWAATRAYVVGDSVYAGGKNYDCTTAGTSGGSAPTWPASGTVTDGTVVWTEGGDAGADTLLGTLTCADPAATVAAGVVTFGAVTQDVSADAGGKARKAVFTDSADTVVIELDVTNEAGTGAVKVNTQTIVAAGPIQLASQTITVGGG
jgi:hypothetical protein